MCLRTASAIDQEFDQIVQIWCAEDGKTEVLVVVDMVLFVFSGIFLLFC